LATERHISLVHNALPHYLWRLSHFHRSGWLRMPKLLDQVRDLILLRHYSYHTEQTYLSCIRQFILFNKKRHPVEMGHVEVTAFLSHLASESMLMISGRKFWKTSVAAKATDGFEGIATWE